MEQENNLQEDISSIVSGTYATNKLNNFRLTGRLALWGLVGGFVYGVMFNKSKLTCAAIGAFGGGLIGYGFKQITNE
ncbi:MAG: hypothetical protein KBG30_01605 [Bacteroidales bacterium]|jgi:hypothetical protein|nr:hypothetical protein [Bacteroidales bacterium]